MLRLKNIYKNYLVDKKPFPALKNINLNFDKIGFVSILGPSGCGKTTLLNLIGGLDQYTSGDLIINDRSTKEFKDADWDAYRNKRVGFVFQSYNLVPHLSVLGNVEISMTLSGMNKKERTKKALDALNKVGLKKVAKKRPNQLSGGQMQRVAIARSLVNDPEIILADEPTGALDSVTSVQVMEILKKVSKKKLVIMVTHNNELADKYSTRIIRLKDGVIMSDSNPCKLDEKQESKKLVKDNNQHTHMSFKTALQSSGQSLLTKKGRATLTAVAASFGIIGVSLVLALSNGFTNYVKRVELSTASTVPITVSPYVPTNTRDVDANWTAWPDDKEIIPFDDDMTGGMAVHHNIITNEFAEYCKKLTTSPTHYAYSVLENHEGLDFNIYTKKPDNSVIKIDQYTSSGTTGTILSSIGGLPSSIFHELYGGRDYINSLYDVVAGHYPTNKNELLVVCDRYNRIPTKTLAKLGITNSESDKTKISFNDILDKEYKCFMPDKVYTTEVSKTISTSYDFANATGISIPDGASITGDNILSLNSTPVSKTIKQYTEEDPSTLYSTPVDGTDVLGLKIVGIIRPSRTSMINLMPGSVCYTSELKDFYVDSFEGGKSDKYKAAMLDNWAITDQTSWNNTCSKILTLLSQSKYVEALAQLVELKECITYYGITTTDETSTPTAIKATETMSQYDIYTMECYKFSTEFNSFGIEDDIGLAAITVPSPSVGILLLNGKNIVDALTNINGYSTITSILIFPRDLARKPLIFDYIAKYNEDKDEEHQIVYSDIAGTITDAVGTLIQMISVVLIIFSSVSLLVSCVMTGVITYTSVLERTKEIGILRAIGARKKDVGRLFEAESMIIGGLGGFIGVLVAYIAEGPINLIVEHNFPAQGIGMICDFHPLHALLLIAISVLLTFVSGFIPARKAANKDPVVALRTE